MKLIELLAVCNENTVITVWDATDKFVAEYNGKDSIDEKYNNCKVLSIGGGYDGQDNVIEVTVEVQ